MPRGDNPHIIDPDNLPDQDIGRHEMEYDVSMTGSIGAIFDQFGEVSVKEVLNWEMSDSQRKEKWTDYSLKDVSIRKVAVSSGQYRTNGFRNREKMVKSLPHPEWTSRGVLRKIRTHGEGERVDLGRGKAAYVSGNKEVSVFKHSDAPAEAEVKDCSIWYNESDGQPFWMFGKTYVENTRRIVGQILHSRYTERGFADELVNRAVDEEVVKFSEELQKAPEYRNAAPMFFRRETSRKRQELHSAYTAPAGEEPTKAEQILEDYIEKELELMRVSVSGKAEISNSEDRNVDFVMHFEFDKTQPEGMQYRVLYNFPC